MEKQRILTKINLFIKDKIFPVSIVPAIMLFSAVLLYCFYKLVNSLEESNWNPDSRQWLLTFVFGLVSFIIVFIRGSFNLIKTNSIVDRAIDVVERSNDIAQKLSEIIEKPRNPRALIEKFLGIKSVYIYYVDSPRVNALHQQVAGRKQLQEVTEELVGEQGLGLSIGVKDIARGELSDKTTNKLSATSQIKDTSIEEQFLIVQSTLLRGDYIELGYEHSIFQIENDIIVDEDYDNAAIIDVSDYDKWFSKEVERLNALSGYILLEANFLVQEFDIPQNNYQFTFTRPIVQNTIFDPTVKFKITIAKELISINDQLTFYNHLGKKVNFRVFGRVSFKSEGKSPDDKVIDIAPIVIYT